MFRRICLTSLLAASALSACVDPEARTISGPAAGPERATEHVITGQLTYRERIALIPGSMAEVTLIDVSLADAPAKVIAKQQFSADGAQVPFAFELSYDPSQIDARHTYSVSARIEVDGKLRFISDTAYRVITDEAKTPC